MAYQFTQAFPKYAYQPGCLFLGLDDNGNEIGIDTERHAVTVATARSGKGAALLVQNARRWPDNLLLIDPKGENIELCWQDRQRLGQSVRVLDPFRCADVPDDLRAGFNPFDLIDPDSLTAREDLAVIADGIVLVHDPKHMEWVEGTRSLIAGVSAYVMETADDASRHLGSVRALLKLDKATLRGEVAHMLACQGFGGMAQTAGDMILTGLDDSDSMEADFLQKAKRATEWLDSTIRETVTRSTFDLRDLKSGQMTVALVLPPNVIRQHAVFLRLFVRLAINVMANGDRKKRRCLFLLDEFHLLGRIDEIAQSAGLMPGYGLHLWPFLQDINQLQDLYGKAAETFFANSDAQIFFAANDPVTLRYISARAGNLTPNEITTRLPQQKELFWPSQGDKERAQHKYANEKTAYDHSMRLAGSPRLPPDVIAALTAKGPGDVVARSMVVFLPGDDILNLRLAPYFMKQDQRAAKTEKRLDTSYQNRGNPAIQYWHWEAVSGPEMILLFAVSMAVFMMLGSGPNFSGNGPAVDGFIYGLVMSLIKGVTGWRFSSLWAK